MLILCTGEDSFRSVARAKELEAAYREKYDVEGRSVQRLSPGKDGVDELLTSLSSSSLFSPRQFFRCNDLTSACAQIKRNALLKSLSRDSDMAIVVSVESKPLKSSELKPFLALPKCITYDYPALSPDAFAAWGRSFASAAGVSDEAAISMIARKANGNAWDFVNEFMKWRAGGTVAAHADEITVYDVVDSFLTGQQQRWSKLRAFDDTSSVLSSAVHQARAFVQIQSGDASGIHPYVAGKLKRHPKNRAGSAFTCLATAFLWSRSGHGDSEESLTALG